MPSLSPDHFSGLPGFFLSAREAVAADQSCLNKYKINMVAPEGTKAKMAQGVHFMGYYVDHMEIKELKDGVILEAENASMEFPEKNLIY